MFSSIFYIHERKKCVGPKFCFQIAREFHLFPSIFYMYVRIKCVFYFQRTNPFVHVVYFDLLYSLKNAPTKAQTIIFVWSEDDLMSFSAGTLSS